MSMSHFFKQLPYYYSLTRHLLNHRSPPSALFSLASIKNSLSSSTPISFFTTASPSSSSSSLVTDASGTEPYLSVRIRCPKQAADPFSEALLCFGASSVSIDEEDPCDTSNVICIDSIFPVNEEVRACVSQAAYSIGLKEIPNYEVEMGAEYDWVKKTQESFRPVEVTRGLWIVPEWISPPDVEATNIILNPGLAFGTGEHPTTKLCLLLLRRLIKGNELFLDYGTGSGVLAIAAVKFGAGISVGVDIDPVAITSARHNATLNNVRSENFQLHLISNEPSPASITEDAGKYQGSCRSETLLEHEKFDIVIANILLNPLLELADQIVSYAKPGATVGISGILTEQLPYIKERYSQLLDDISVSEIDDWACVSGIKKRRDQTHI